MRALLKIAIVDAMASSRGFAVLHQFVRRIRVARRRHGDPEQLCRDIDRAAVYYPRRLHCLRRSAAMTWLLRSCGYPAEMMIGVSVTPFLAHAWVELDDGVIGDDEVVIRQRYTVIERCPPPPTA
ncbi:MAG: hypothetical protein QOE82_723 [Thermoanaerobaculia bacterium]|jgi:hypothetical protein|nr:hypothetical protein [Thermoanaerobaculia bacterium]